MSGHTSARNVRFSFFLLFCIFLFYFSQPIGTYLLFFAKIADFEDFFDYFFQPIGRYLLFFAKIDDFEDFRITSGRQEYDRCCSEHLGVLNFTIPSHWSHFWIQNI